LGLTLGWFAGNEISPFYVLWLMTRYMVIINLGLGIFNLIPIPPLDGSKILYAFLPPRVIVKIVPYEKYLQFAMLLLLWIGALSVPIQRGVTFFLNLFTDLAMGVFF
jgi:Zn-dependent protease